MFDDGPQVRRRCERRRVGLGPRRMFPSGGVGVQVVQLLHQRSAANGLEHGASRLRFEFAIFKQTGVGPSFGQSAGGFGRELGGKDDFEEAARLGNVFGEGEIHFRPEGQNAPKSRDGVTRPSIVEHREWVFARGGTAGVGVFDDGRGGRGVLAKVSHQIQRGGSIGQVVVTQLFPGELFGLKDAIA